MVARLDMLVRGIAATPRRNVFHAVVGAGLVALAPVGQSQSPGAAKRKKKKGKDRCPTCPASCSFRFSAVNGKTICGIGSSVQQGPCKPCTSDSDCTSAAFPHCINAVKIISTGQTVGLGVCQTTPTVGFFCANVSACVT